MASGAVVLTFWLGVVGLVLLAAIVWMVRSPLHFPRRDLDRRR